MKSFIGLVVYLVVLGACAPCVSGQQATAATLGGRVTDPQGAVVPGAQITVNQKATGIRREAITNDEGLYVLSNLPPGEYEVRVEKQGLGLGSIIQPKTAAPAFMAAMASTMAA